MIMRNAALGVLLLSNAVALGQNVRPSVDVEVLQQGTIPEPLDLEFSNDGHLWLSGRRGELYIIPKGTNDMRLIQRIPTDFSGERGLHGIEFHPDYPNTPIVYLYRSTVNEDDEHFNQLVRFKVVNPESPATLSLVEDKVYLEFPSEENGYHQGGAIEYNPKDGKLYVSTGDNYRSPETDQFYNDPNARTFRLDDLRGKTLRLELDGSIPADNPFVGVPGARGEIWTVGHRNPYTMAVDPKTGDVYVGEVGYDLVTSYEEVNKLQRGANYGWPRCQGTNYGTFGGTCPLQNAIDPFLTYIHQRNASITLGPVVRQGVTPGSLPPEYGDGIFYADFSRNFLRFGKFADDGKSIVESFQIAANIPTHPLAMQLSPDGYLYILMYGGWFTPAEGDALVRVRINKPDGSDVGTQSEGELTIQSWLESGTALYNNRDCALTLSLASSGSWSYAPGQTHGPQGVARHVASQSFYLPGSPEGALIATTDRNTYTLIGTSGQLVVPAHGTARFLINDSRGDMGSTGFEDNKGDVKLRWTVMSCN